MCCEVNFGKLSEVLTIKWKKVVDKDL